MHISRQTLHNIAVDTAKERALSSSTCLAIFLCGSILDRDPFLGGAADIDLVIIHTNEPETPREIQSLNELIHLDIQHQPESQYRKPRELRVHPWFGPLIYGFEILYDPNHFLDFIQASVRGLYDRPENVLARSKAFFSQAQQFVHANNSNQGSLSGFQNILAYLDALYAAGNAIASLSGTPLSERRFFLDLPDRAGALAHPDISGKFLDLIVPELHSPESLMDWLVAWQETFDISAHQDHADSSLHPARKAYYLQYYQVLLANNRARSMLWSMLKTWSLAMVHLPENEKARSTWNDVCTSLGFHESGWQNKLAGFEALLMEIDGLLHDWGVENGAD